MKSAPIAEDLQNHLLAALPLPVRQRLLPLLEHCTLPLGKVLYEARAPITHAWFPTDAIVSLIYITAEGNTADISLVGNEGVVGIAPILGGDMSLTKAVVHCAGGAYRMSTRALMDELERHTELRTQVLRYVQALMTQMGQTAICNRYHSLEQQLCRWLLLALDRIPGRELHMTQELIANMMGVRREGVTLAARKLQKRGIIMYSRGHIRVIDRKELERLSCECYRVVKTETDRLLAVDYLPPPDKRQAPGRLPLLRS